MQDLKQSTAATVEVGPILNVDGTPYVTDNLTNADFLVSKNGTPSALHTTATAASHVSGDLQGMFLVTLDTTDTGTLGRLTVMPNKATLAGVSYRGMVRPATWFDSVVTGSGGAIPGVAASASGGLPTVGTGSGQINPSNGKVPATVAAGDGADASSVKTTIGTAGAGLTALGDTRLANLDATVSSRSTYAGGAVASVTGTVGGIAGTTQTLDALQTALSSAHGGGSWATATGFSTLTTTDIDNRLAAWGKTGFSISGTLTTLDALLTQLATTHGTGSWATATGFSTHSAADVVTALGTGTTLTSLATAASQTTIIGYVDCLPATWVVPAAVGAAMTLTSAYDAAKLAASQSSVNAIAAILTGITSLAAWLRGLFRKSTMDATAKSEVNTGGGTYNEATDSAEALSEAVSTVAAVTAKVDTMLVLDGAVYQFTANAVELAPSGTGLDAAGVRSAIGLATANLDAQLAAIVEDTGTTLPTQISGIAAGSGPTVEQIRAEMDTNSTKLAGIKTKTDLITSGTAITVVSPVVTEKTLEIVRGDDYFTADGRSISWTDSGGTWPDLTGATVVLSFRSIAADALMVAVTGAAENTGTATQTIRFQPTAADTAKLTVDKKEYELYKFDAEAILANGHKATLRWGQATVLNDCTR